MKLRVGESDGQGFIAVTLSERNLLALLQKVHAAESERTIFKEYGDLTLFVECEKDEDHYIGRSDGPAGAMSLDSEAFISEHTTAGIPIPRERDG